MPTGRGGGVAFVSGRPLSELGALSSIEAATRPPVCTAPNCVAPDGGASATGDAVTLVRLRFATGRLRRAVGRHVAHRGDHLLEVNPASVDRGAPGQHC